MTTIKQLWTDEHGFVASTDLLLISTILVLGTIVGLVSLRDQVVQEFGDLGGAIGQLNQSYNVEAVSTDAGDAAGSSYEDLSDFCEAEDEAGQASGNISVVVPASEEESQGG